MQEKKLTRAKKVIEALRKHYGLKVGEFADKLGVGASTVSTWANRDSLDNDLVFRICEGVSFDFLLTGEGEPFPQPKPEVADPAPSYHDNDPRLIEIQRLWGSICHSQRDTLLSVAKGFAKQPPETSPENEEKVIDLYEKRSA